MLNVWLASLGSVAAVSLISLVGVVALAWQENQLRRVLFWLVALSAGALLGDVFIHIFPELFANGAETLPLSIAILGGILIFFGLEKFLAWHHSHQVLDCPTCDHHTHAIAPFGYLNLISDGLHNLIDGIIIAAGFLSSPAIGLATTFAVILHEIPQEIGDFGVLLQAGFSRWQAIIFNLLSASLAILGATLTLLIGSKLSGANDFLLALTAGGFVYLAGSDLVPELHKTTEFKKSLGQLIALIAGIGLMAALTLLE